MRKQSHNHKKLHVIDPGLVAAFKANPGRDVGRKLETAMFTPSGQSFPGVGALALRPGQQASPHLEHATALAQVIDRFCTLREGALC